jgi:copper(I)-binding protein
MRLLLAALISLATATAVELLSSRSYAHEYTVGAILVFHPVVAPPPGGQTTTAGYMRLTNSGSAPDRLVSASSSAARAVEIHETRAGAGGMMSMQALPNGVAIPANGTVTFAPGGLHLMIIGLSGRLREGDSIPITLVFERAGAVEVMGLVERPRAGAEHRHTH